MNIGVGRKKRGQRNSRLSLEKGQSRTYFLPAVAAVALVAVGSVFLEGRPRLACFFTLAGIFLYVALASLSA